MNLNTTSSNTLLVKRFIKAPRERVFTAWTNPEELKKWFGPETCQVTAATLEARAGGAYHMHVQSELMGEVDVRGVYREVSPFSRLVFTWNWSGNLVLEFGETLVTVDLMIVEGGTDVQITHEQFPKAELRRPNCGITIITAGTVAWIN